MDILYLLVPMSVFAMLGILGVFAWALHGGQFDDLEAVGAHILDSTDLPLAQALPDAAKGVVAAERGAGSFAHAGPAIDGDQGPPSHALEESIPSRSSA
jgi:cbb3-type cytochrome oxidase maturation protein